MRKWDLLTDSQGLIALFVVRLDVDQNLLTAQAGLYHKSVDVDPELTYLFLCPEFKVIVRLNPEHTFPGNLYIQEFGEKQIEHYIERVTMYKSRLDYLYHNPKHV